MASTVKHNAELSNILFLWFVYGFFYVWRCKNQL